MVILYLYYKTSRLRCMGKQVFPKLIWLVYIIKPNYSGRQMQNRDHYAIWPVSIYPE